MRTIRIHVDQPLSVGGELALPGQAGEHVARVLRLTPGDALVLFNGDGHDYAAIVLQAARSRVVVTVHEARQLHNESPLPLTLAQGLARGDKMDLIMQKATELGVARIVPLLTERSEIRLDPTRAEKRLAHWRAVVASACEQCGRARLPEVLAAQPLSAWLDALTDNGALRLALDPGAGLCARQLLPGAGGAILVTGPEGGLGERDLTLLSEHRFERLNLGPRVLRTETAGLAALAALQAVHGDG